VEVAANVAAVSDGGWRQLDGMEALAGGGGSCSGREIQSLLRGAEASVPRTSSHSHG